MLAPDIRIYVNRINQSPVQPLSLLKGERKPFRFQDSHYFFFQCIEKTRKISSVNHNVITD